VGDLRSLSLIILDGRTMHRKLDKRCTRLADRAPGWTAAAPNGDLMELNGWTSPQMLTRYGASARGARARRSYGRIMDDT
jgi:hypothetical protein